METTEVQAESIIQKPKCDVQTQIPDGDHKLVQLMPKDQMKQLQGNAAAPFIEEILEQNKQVQVDLSSHSETLKVNEPVPLSRPHILIQVVSSNHPQVRPLYSVLSSQDETVPEALSTQTPVKHDSSVQRPILTHKHVLFKDQVQVTDIQDPANPVPIAGTTNDILESVPSLIAVEQLLQEAEHTGRIVTLNNKVSLEALVRRRDEMRELNEKCDIKHKDFIKRIEGEDNEKLNRILLRKFTATSSQSDVSVLLPQINQPTNQIEDIIRSELTTDYKQLNSHAAVVVEQNRSVSESLPQDQVSVYFKVKKMVDKKRCPDFPILH
jgi:hypothetical protein